MLRALRQSSWDWQDGNWGVVNDNVMGGESKGTARWRGDILEFDGTISLENNGGFSRVRNNFDRYENMSDYDQMVIRVKGDGRKYEFQLFDDDWFSTYYT